MKRTILAAAALLVSAGTATAVQAASAAPVPPGVTVSGMTYQPGAHVPPTHLPHLTPVNGAFQSTNWSGYADVTCSTCALRFVAASFTLPAVNCKNSPDGSFAAFFVGLDGIGDSTVEQIGVTASCSGGNASYLPFYEMFPLAPVAFSGIGPGDAISVSVYFNAATNHWQLGLTDLTTGGKITTAQTCPKGSTCRNRSAEVIAEAPSSSGGAILPLANFSQANFEAVQVTSRNGTHGALTSNSLWTTDSLTMVNSTGSATLAAPGPAYGGQAFQDTWRAAQ
jgi:peptidase A4-like protein